MADEPQASPVPLDGLDDSRKAFLTLLAGMSRTLNAYVPVVRPELYNDADVLAALRHRVVSQPKVRVQLLLPPAYAWRSACPGLVRLNEQLTTALILRTPNREETPDQPQLGQGFLIADERALLHLSDPRRLLGAYYPEPTGRTRELLNLFRGVWDRAQADPELRRLGI